MDSTVKGNLEKVGLQPTFFKDVLVGFFQWFKESETPMLKGIVR